MALLAMVSEFGDSQYIEFKPRISPLRWTRPKPSMVLFSHSRTRFYMMHVARFIQSSVSYKPELRLVHVYHTADFCAAADALFPPVSPVSWGALVASARDAKTGISRFGAHSGALPVQRGRYPCF